MSYIIALTDGPGFPVTTRSGVSAGPSMTAPATITLATNLGGAFGVGSIVKITGKAQPANNGIFTVSSVTTGTRIFTVAEGGLKTEGTNAAGTLVWYGTVASPPSTTLSTDKNITNFYPGSIIECNAATPATYITDGIRKGDTAIVLSAGFYLSGSYRIEEVLSETEIKVAGASKGKTSLTKRTGIGTCRVKGGSYTCDIEDEAAPSWAAMQANAIGPDSSIGSDYITIRDLGDRLSLVLTHGLRQVRISHTTNNATEWVSEREVVINDRQDAAPSQIRYASGTTPGDLVRLGRPGPDRYGADFGSFWFGWKVTCTATIPGPADSLSFSTYGSAMSTIVQTGQQAQSTGNQGSMVASLIDGLAAIAVGGDSPVVGAEFTGTVESIINRPTTAGIRIFGSPAGGYDNSLFTSSLTSPPSIGYISGGVEGYIQGFLGSSALPLPYFGVLEGSLTVLNPRYPYLAANLFDITGTGGTATGYVSYTWAPRFVERGSGVPIPIENLTVTIYSIDELTLIETEIAGSPFLTNASGRIPASGPGADLVGSGIDLIRSFATEEGAGKVTYDYSHRVIVEGAGYRRVDAYFTMHAAKIDFDFPVDILRTDYEGELST